MKTSELTGAALDWAVAKCEGESPSVIPNGHYNSGKVVIGWKPSLDDHIYAEYSTDWAQGGPIIEKIKGFELKIWLESESNSRCEAHIHNCEGNWIEFGSTPLEAAMRCYVASKFGDEIEIPKELL